MTTMLGLDDVIAAETVLSHVDGEAGRLSYVQFRKVGLPIGSGGIESSIRRVINLRLKSNGMFWGDPQAETMLQVRAQIISGRWDERLKAMRELSRRDGHLDWNWDPQPMSVKSEPANTAQT